MLALAAAVTGRVPVVPSVPCASKWLERHHMSVQGVTDDYVLQVYLLWLHSLWLYLLWLYCL